MNEETKLIHHIRIWLGIFIAGLVVSGLTAFPLQHELSFLVSILSPLHPPQALIFWLRTVDDALIQTNLRYPFLAYGTDWLAFGHLVIAVAFVGAWRDPVRNKWLIDFGLIACAGVLPLALIAGGVRGIPFCWRLIDMSFGVFGAIPLLLCRRWIAQIERRH